MVQIAAQPARERAPEQTAERLGGIAGNETLTSAVALILTLLLMAEGITILFIGSLRNEHMFIGMVLIPPVLLKLGSTGWRRSAAATRARSRYARPAPRTGR